MPNFTALQLPQNMAGNQGLSTTGRMSIIHRGVIIAPESILIFYIRTLTKAPCSWVSDIVLILLRMILPIRYPIHSGVISKICLRMTGLVRIGSNWLVGLRWSCSRLFGWVIRDGLNSQSILSRMKYLSQATFPATARRQKDRPGNLIIGWLFACLSINQPKLFELRYRSNHTLITISWLHYRMYRPSHTQGGAQPFFHFLRY